jgi:hypothetical protein
MGTKFEITVGGRWLSMESFYGEVELSTVWPGGSDEVSWTPAVTPVRRFSGGEPVVVYYAGDPGVGRQAGRARPVAGPAHRDRRVAGRR